MGWRGRCQRVPESVSPHPQSLPRDWSEEKEALARPWGDTAEIGRPEWRGTLIGDSFWDCLGLARALQALPGGSENRPADAAKAAEQQAVSDASELHIQECEPWSPGSGKTGLLSCI